MLELEATAEVDTITLDSPILVRWTIRNPGPSQEFRDFAAFYQFALLGPTGELIEPEFDHRGHATTGEAARQLRTGDELSHEVDLRCVAEPLSTTTGQCALAYRIRSPGDY